MENTTAVQTVELTGLVENPQKLINNAHIVAKEFNKIVSAQKLFTNIQSKPHIHADGWSMLGVLLGVFPQTLKTERVKAGTFIAVLVKRKNSYGKDYTVWTDKDRMKKTDVPVEERTKDEIIYKAEVALFTPSNRKLAQITATCSNREDGKVDNDEYAIESMAQTRGTGKVYRTAFGWIARMAGYESTPFEEATEEMYHEEVSVKPPASAELMESILNRIELCKNPEDLGDVVNSIAEYSEELNEADTQALRKAVINKRASFKAPAQKQEDKKEVQKEVKGKVKEEQKAPPLETPTFENEKVNKETGEIKEPEHNKAVEGEIVDRKHKKIEPKKEPSSFWTMTKISSVVESLNTESEVKGFKDELNTIYGQGEITETVWKYGISNCQMKLNKLVRERQPAIEQSELPNE